MKSSFISLLKLIFKTRYTTATLLLFLFLISINIISRTYATNSEIPYSIRIYYTGIFTMLCAIAIIAGGLLLLKSDADYLLTLPLPKSNLVFAFFILQFLSYSIPLLYLLTSFLSFNNVYSILTSVSLLIFLTNLSIISFNLSMKKKIIILMLVIFWLSLPLIGIYYSPSAIFFENSLNVSLISITTAMISSFFSLRILFNTELELAKRTVALTSGEVKNEIDFKDSKGTKAINRFYTSGFMLTLRMNMMGISRISTARVNFKYILIASIILSIIYIAIFRIILIRDIILQSSAIIVTATISILLGVLLTTGTLSHERIWLAFTAMDPADYLKQVFKARFNTLLILFLPFVIANLYLYSVGIKDVLSLVFLYLAFIPSFSTLFILITNWIKPVQIKEETYIAFQFSLRDIVIMFLFILALVIGALSIIQLFSIAISMTFLIFYFYIIKNKNILRELSYKLSENGFV